jgi:3-hydroxyisobutyrate dehydrogenase-like beta-hydroxyacid dehydrogenase
MAPALAPRHIVLAHSTVSPYSMRAAADVVERRGARFVEAPFTGSKIAAEKGELVFYVAGDEAALREARPILEGSAKEIIEIGEIGQATTIKVATNIVTAASVQAAAEALALIHNAGLSLEKFIAAMRGNASNSGTLSIKLPKMIEGDFEPHFSVKHMLKDMQIANRLGLMHHIELAVTAAARDRLLEQMQRGYGDEDYSAVARKYFPEIGSAGSEETNLELFERFAPAEPPAIAPFNEEITAPFQGANVLPMAEEASQHEPEVQQGQTASPVNSMITAADSENQKPEGRNESVAAAEAIAPGSAEEQVEENSGRRGLFSRLLRRGREY